MGFRCLAVDDFRLAPLGFFTAVDLERRRWDAVLEPDAFPPFRRLSFTPTSPSLLSPPDWLGQVSLDDPAEQLSTAELLPYSVAEEEISLATPLCLPLPLAEWGVGVPTGPSVDPGPVVTPSRASSTGTTFAPSERSSLQSPDFVSTPVESSTTSSSLVLVDSGVEEPPPPRLPPIQAVSAPCE